MDRIDKEQAVFEQLTLSDFKKGSFRALKTNGKQTYCRLSPPSPSELTSRIHALIFLWTPKGFISPEYFRSFF